MYDSTNMPDAMREEIEADRRAHEERAAPVRAELESKLAALSGEVDRELERQAAQPDWTRSLPDLAQEFAEETTRHFPQLADLARPHLFAELTEAISDARATEPVELEAVHVGLTAEQHLRDLGLVHARAQVGDCGMAAYVDDIGAEEFDEDPGQIEREIAAAARMTLLLAEHYRRYLDSGTIPAVPADGDPAPAHSAAFEGSQSAVEPRTGPGEGDGRTVRICGFCANDDHVNCTWDEEAPPSRCACVCPTRAEVTA